MRYSLSIKAYERGKNEKRFDTSRSFFAGSLMGKMSKLFHLGLFATYTQAFLEKAEGIAV